MCLLRHFIDAPRFVIVLLQARLAFVLALYKCFESKKGNRKFNSSRGIEVMDTCGSITPDARRAPRRCTCSARSPAPYVPVAFPVCCIQELSSQTMDFFHGLDNALNTLEQLIQC